MAASSKIHELARQIVATTEKLDSYHELHGQATPTLEPGAVDISPDGEYHRLQMSLASAADELQALVAGPGAWMCSMVLAQGQLVALQVAALMGMFDAVPLSGSIHLSELAKKLNLDVERTGSVVRMLASRYIFVETGPDVFSHTAASYLLATNEDALSFIQLEVDEMYKCGTETVACLQKNGDKSDPVNSPFYMRYGESMYAFMNERPSRAQRFAKGMAGYSKFNNPPSQLIDQYPWASLGKTTIVDVGGGNGYISRFLARAFPDLRFVVQDSSETMLEQGRQSLTDDIRDRVSFMTGDYFEAQSVRDAGAYFIRQCIHNANDENGAKILRNFVPALEQRPPGTPLFVNERVLPALDTMPKFEEAQMRFMDIMMMTSQGAKQRSQKQFEDLLAQADKRLKLVKIHVNGGLGLLEIHLVRD